MKRRWCCAQKAEADRRRIALCRQVSRGPCIVLPSARRRRSFTGRKCLSGRRFPSYFVVAEYKYIDLVPRRLTVRLCKKVTCISPSLTTIFGAINEQVLTLRHRVRDLPLNFLTLKALALVSMIINVSTTSYLRIAWRIINSTSVEHI